MHQNKFQIAITTPIGKKTTGDHRLFIMFHLSYHSSKYISVCKLLHNHSRNGLEVEEYVCNYTSLSERCLISSKKGYPLPDPTTIIKFSWVKGLYQNTQREEHSLPNQEIHVVVVTTRIFDLQITQYTPRRHCNTPVLKKLKYLVSASRQIETRPILFICLGCLL